MKIFLKNITEKTMDYSDVTECTEITNNGDEIKFEDNIKFNGTLRKGEDFVEIVGAVSADFTTLCHSCGGVANGKLEFDINEVYRREPSDMEYQLIGNEVDFDDMIIENVRLNLPIKILCGVDCKGISQTTSEE